MPETVQDLPKNAPQRNAIAAQLSNIRQIEQMGKMTTDRDGKDYLIHLKGISYLFDYVRGLDEKTILDVGAGTTQGIHELAQHYGKGLKFLATVLRNDPRIDNNLGRENVILTTVEKLRGIANASIGGVIGCESIMYAAVPELAIARLDEVLTQGGVLKATFVKKPESQTFFREYGLKTKEKFLEKLLQLGYDDAVADGLDNREVLLAIKPGGIKGRTARELLDLDKMSAFDQLRQIMKLKNPTT